MAHMLSFTHAQRAEMGLRGRAKMEAEFDEQIVIRKYLAAIEEVLARRLQPRKDEANVAIN